MDDLEPPPLSARSAISAPPPATATVTMTALDDQRDPWAAGAGASPFSFAEPAASLRIERTMMMWQGATPLWADGVVHMTLGDTPAELP